MNFNQSKFSKGMAAGFGTIEILIITVIIGLSLVSLTGVGNLAFKISDRMKKNVIATNLANEALEATRSIKEGSWTTLANYGINSIYHPVKTGSPLQWSLTLGNESINGFVRQVIIENVYRDANDDIVTNGGAIDANTKKITATVSWADQGNPYQVKLSYYLTNWKP